MAFIRTQNPDLTPMIASKEGFDLYQARPDKGYSLTDCISMLAIRHEGIREILTHDDHFTQEGFVILF